MRDLSHTANILPSTLRPKYTRQISNEAPSGSYQQEQPRNIEVDYVYNYLSMLSEYFTLDTSKLNKNICFVSNANKKVQ